MGFYIEVDKGVELYVEDLIPHKQTRGTILFLHGWPLSHKQFEYQFDVLPAEGIRCIGVDWRGFGKSDKPWDGYRYDRLADDIGAVIDALQLENITLAGHSTGGAIAIRYAARHRAKGVARLALINAASPTGFTPEAADSMLRQSAADRPQMMLGITDTFFFQYKTQPLADWFTGLGLEAAGWSTAAVIRMLRDENLYADLPQIAVPTLIIHGVHDQVIPFAQAVATHRLIRGSQLAALQLSGHGSFLDERDRVNSLLRQFCG